MAHGQLARIFGSLAIVVALVAAAPAAEQGDQTTLRIGEPAPDFTLKDVRTGDDVKLSDFKGDKIVVVTFQSTKCPWNYMRPEAGYERVLYPLSQAYAAKDVVFLAINSNASESAESLKAYAEEHETPYPILKDPGNEVADAYGGKTTPHFFLIDKQGILRYQGGYEQSPTNPQKCGQMDEQYLVPAIEAVLAGAEPAQTVTKSKGCTIERAR